MNSFGSTWFSSAAYGAGPPQSGTAAAFGAACHLPSTSPPACGRRSLIPAHPSSCRSIGPVGHTGSRSPASKWLLLERGLLVVVPHNM